MFEEILRNLTIWRNNTARKEGVELFRVLPNATLEAIAKTMPKDKEEMITIKGIKEAKFAKYGKEILSIIKPSSENKEDIFLPVNYKVEKQKVLTISDFLDKVNQNLQNLNVRMEGEVSSVDFRERVIYFTLKDKNDQSTINCFIFRYQYEILSVKLEEGLEVILEGVGEIYKPYGRFSFKTSVIEVKGEGVLRKEYEQLKKKLEKHGFFDENKKKRFIEAPQKIGLITSREGAAIGDFTSNVGKFGLEIKFINSSVEGKRAIFELLEAVKFFQKYKKIDVLVIIRGGGSLESLQAFNNETLIKEVKNIKVPVVCGVGHDRDISLLSLSSDYAVSTPTAAAKIISSLWEEKINKINNFEREIFYNMQDKITYSNQSIKENSYIIKNYFQNLLFKTQNIFDNFTRENLRFIYNSIENEKFLLNNKKLNLINIFDNKILTTRERIGIIQKEISINNPERQLRMGYGIISQKGKGVKSIKELKIDDDLKIRMVDGEIESKINKIKNI